MMLKATTNRSELARALELAARVSSSRSTPLDTLRNVLIANDTSLDNRLVIGATDLVKSMVCGVNAQVQGSGTVAVSARAVAEFVGNLSEDEVQIEVDSAKHTLRIVSQSADATFVGMSADDFPRLPSDEGALLFPINADIFRRMLKRTAFAASQDESRIALQGVLFKLSREMLEMVASDGYRLSLCQARPNVPLDLTTPITALVPAKALEETIRAMGAREDVISVGISTASKAFVIRAANVTFFLRLVEQSFPDYAPLIPSSATCRTRLKISKTALQNALRRMLIFAGDSYNAVTLTITPSAQDASGRVQMQAASPNLGNSVAIIDAEVTGDSLSLSFNGEFLLEGIDAVEDDVVSLEFTEANKPLALRETQAMQDTHYTHFIYVMMPMITVR